MGMGGRSGGGQMGGGMVGSRRAAAPRPMATGATSRTGGGSSGRMGGSPKRMANAPTNRQQRRQSKRMANASLTPRQKKIERREKRQERRQNRRQQKTGQQSRPGSSESSDDTGFDMNDYSGIFNAVSDWFGQEEPEDFRTQKFDPSSLDSPYERYSDDDEEGWITGLMKSGQKGYDLPANVTLQTAINSPFRYYGQY
jgi:hypothetical protein